MIYKVKTGYGQALVDLVAMNPQPHSRGIQFTRTTFSADGSAHNEAPYIILEWDVIESPTAYTTLLTQFGLSAGTYSANVTVYIPNNVYTATRYNGIAILPPASHDNFFIRNVQMVIKDLSAL